MSTEANEAIVRRYWDAWNTGDATIIDEVVATDYVFNDTGRVLHGNETLKRGIVRWYRGFFLIRSSLLKISLPPEIG